MLWTSLLRAAAEQQVNVADAQPLILQYCTQAQLLAQVIHPLAETIIESSI
jgi:hypothetical protein